MRRKYLIRVLALSTLTIGVMVINSPAASAKILELLNNAHVSSMTLESIVLNVSLTAENGLKMECSGAVGSISLMETGKTLSSSSSYTFKDCVWVGSESTCTINDEGEGTVNASGSGEATTTIEGKLVITTGSTNFATIFTEGVFCTIPEEEEISGQIHSEVLNSSSSTTVKTGHLSSLNLKLGGSNVTELAGEEHLRDQNNLSASFGFCIVP